MDLILVDKDDKVIGTSEKHSAHTNGGHLHRSFSVLLFDNNKRLLIHQRAKGKYHTSLLWTNTCCSHPKPNESTSNAVKRRLVEELGSRDSVEEVFSFTYKSKLDNEMTEHEFEHVFLGVCNNDKDLNTNIDEIAEIKWLSISDVCTDIKAYPGKYTPWFKIIMSDYLDIINDWLDKNIIIK